MVATLEADDDGEVVLVTTVEIASGFSRPIRLRSGDSTSDKALEFCKHFCLSADVAASLARHLQDNLEKATAGSGEQARAAESPTRPQRISSGSATLVSSPHRKQKQCQLRPDESTVFDRLYSLAQRRKQQKEQAVDRSAASEQHSQPAVSKSGISAKKFSGKFANYGEYLYIEGLANLEQRKQHAQVAHEEQAEREVDGLTFTPEISEKSRAMCPRATVWRRLAHTAPSASAARKRAMYKAESEKDLQECTFQPKINNKSDTMMSQRQATLQRLCMSTYDKLYNDAQVHEDRLQTKRQQLGCSSDPDVSYIQRVGSVDSGKLRPTLSSTFSLDTANPRMAAGDRLYAYHLKKQAKLSRARQAQMFDKDGKPFFRPNTGRAPSEAGSSSAHVPRWESLYSLRNQGEEKRQQLKKQLEEEQRQAQSIAIRVNPKSEKLLAGLLQRRFEQIFEYLNPHHGLLDLLAVRDMPEFDTLSMEISEDVEGAALILCTERGLCGGPITAAVLQDESERRVRILHAVTVLSERRMVGEQSTDVDLDQFSELMGKVLRLNRIPTRTYLLPDIRAPSDAEENLTFQPEINYNSVELAQQRWQDCPRPVHEDLHQHAKTMQTRKEMRARLKELEVLAECTFQPELSSRASFEQHMALHSVSYNSGNSSTGDFDMLPLGPCHASTAQQQLPPGGGSPERNILDLEAPQNLLEDLANMRIETFDEARPLC